MWDRLRVTAEQHQPPAARGLFGSGDALLRIALPLIAGLVALAAALSAALRHESTTPWVCLTIGLSFEAPQV